MYGRVFKVNTFFIKKIIQKSSNFFYAKFLLSIQKKNVEIRNSSLKTPVSQNFIKNNYRFI